MGIKENNAAERIVGVLDANDWVDEYSYIKPGLSSAIRRGTFRRRQGHEGENKRFCFAVT